MKQLLRTAVLVLLVLVAFYALFLAVAGSASPAVFVGAVVVLVAATAALIALRRRSPAVE